MIAIQVPEFNNKKWWYNRDYEMLGKHHQDNNEFDTIDRLYYVYYSGSWEWAWHCIFLKDHKWWVHDMWHCSCNWPLYDIEYWSFETIQEALNKSEFNEQQKDFILKDYL